MAPAVYPVVAIVQIKRQNIKILLNTYYYKTIWFEFVFYLKLD